MRYKFYREHKYVSYQLTRLEQQIAKTNFLNKNELEAIKKEYNSVKQMLIGHAHFEDTEIHVLLAQKKSPLLDKIEKDHHNLDNQFTLIEDKINNIENARSNEDIIEAGYQLYLWFRKFVADNLLHLHDEETILLPELQKLYSDDELMRVQQRTYEQMSVQQAIDMLEELIPHMNVHDIEAFLIEIKILAPEKFDIVYPSIQRFLSKDQKYYLSLKMNFQL